MDFIAKKLHRLGCVHYSHAKTDHNKRIAIESFCENPSCNVFIANPATAGTGLPDLKVANYVVHFDHWWNPAREEQASGRILGIGQKKDAYIVHLWVEDSIEEKIKIILDKKRKLFKDIIDSQTTVGNTGLTIEDVYELFGLPAPRIKTTR